MENVQKHIINKLTVDVETHNPRTAFDLKDNIDTFLKDEILPYLEDYFSSVTEDLHLQTIQIPYLSVNVDTSSVLNFKELKEDVKKEIIKEIKEITNPIKAIENDVVFIKRDQSKVKSILHFLEEGTNPWWTTTDEFFYFDDKEFYELLQSQSFQQKLKQKLGRKQVQDRFISQFTNQQIHQSLKTLFQSNVEPILKKDVLKSIEKLSLNSRVHIWEYLIDFAVNKNAKSLASKLIFELTELIPELPNKKSIENKRKSKSSKNTHSSLKATNETSMVKTIVSILSKMSENQLAFEAINLMIKNKAYYNQVLDVEIQELISNDFQLKQTSETINTDVLDGSITSMNEGSTEYQKKNNIDKIQLESVNPIDKQIDEVETITTSKAEQDHPENDIVLKNEKVQGKDSKSTSKENQKTDKNKQVDKENQLLINDAEIQKVENTSEKKTRENSKEEPLQIHKKDSNLNNQKATKKEPAKNIEKVLKNENETEIKNIDSKEEVTTRGSEPLKENIDVVKGINNFSVENSTNTHAEKTKETTRNKLISKEEYKAGNKTASVEKSNLTDEEIISNSKELKMSMNKLIKGKDRVLLKKSKENKEEKYDEVLKGDYQINNAGLILLHPYLRDFFINCDVLNKDNEFTNPDLAVHLLHYLATKQELQFESNMLFEKILCGVPIKKPIQRNIKLSDELKSSSEELLQAVLNNWGVLKNSSPDLLRGEFLQRFGKISFKDINPKITIERKVYDILLEKLPWNIGISRLPWLDYLLFTDW